MTDINIEQERREFAEVKQDEDQRLEGYTDQYICGNFPLEFKGWLSARRASVGSVEPVRLTFPTLMPQRMWSGSEVQAWLDMQPPLYTAPPSIDAKDAEQYRVLRDNPTTFSPIVHPRFRPDMSYTPDGLDAVCDAAIAAKEP